MFIFAIVTMLVLSFLLSLRSLKKELKKPIEIKMVKEELMKEKILFVKD